MVLAYYLAFRNSVVIQYGFSSHLFQYLHLLEGNK